MTINIITFEDYRIAYAEVGGVHAYLHVVHEGDADHEVFINFASSMEIAREGALVRRGDKPITTYGLYDLLAAEKLFLEIPGLKRAHADIQGPLAM